MAGQGSVYPVAPLLGPGRGAAAGAGHKKECPAPCSGPAAAALPLLHIPAPALGPAPGPGFCSPALGLPGGAMGGGRRPLTSGRRGRWQGTKGRLSREEQEKVEVHL
jgi:hypothetical protein